MGSQHNAANSIFGKIFLHKIFYCFPKNRFRRFLCKQYILQMLTKKSPKISHKFYCESCNYKCSKQSDITNICSLQNIKNLQILQKNLQKSPLSLFVLYVKSNTNLVWDCGNTKKNAAKN